MNIPGYWFESGKSARADAILKVRSDDCEVVVDNTVVCTGKLSTIQISSRVGSIPRHLYWDAGKFETLHNDLVDQALNSVRSPYRVSSVLWRMESSWAIAILALILASCALFGIYRWGIPIAADRVAMSLPTSLNETIADGALATLDEWVFTDTNISESRQRRIQQQFAKLIQDIDTAPFKYELHFRRMQLNDQPIANAMALPNGKIVVTDAFVELVDHPSEIDAVLLHEIGHVKQRHGMRQVVRASALSVVAGMTLGNMSGVSDLISGLPVFLMQSSYSREHETSADTFAFAQMMNSGIDPIHFSNIISRLGGIDKYDDATGEGSSPSKYLSTHPDTILRAKRAATLSREYNR